MALVILLIVMLVMLAEMIHSVRNERALRAGGAIEPADDVYATMRWAYPACFIGMAAEGSWFGAPSAGVVLAGVGVMAAAKALKYWAIVSLGPLWSFHVLVVPGAPLITHGPYAYFRHPNYIGVAGELVAMALMVGARMTGPVAVVLFSLLLVRRIRVEDRALRQQHYP